MKSQNVQFEILIVIIILSENEVKSAGGQSKAQSKKSSNSAYHGVDGNPLSKDILADITQFQVKENNDINSSFPNCCKIFIIFCTTTFKH